MLILRFLARGSDLVTVPDFRPVVGQAPRYVGRRFVPATAEQPASHPATEAPAEYPAGSLEGQRCVKRCRRGELWPADAETARFCGVPMPDLVYDPAGAWDERRGTNGQAETPAAASARRVGAARPATSHPE